MSEVPQPSPAQAEAAESSGRRRDTILGAGLFVFALLLWFWIIPVWASGHGEHVITAQIVAILVGALSLGMIVLTLLGMSVETAAAADDPFVQTRLGQEPANLFLFVAAWAVYLLALPQVGFYIASAVVLPVSIALLGVRRPLILAAATVGTLIVVHLVFERGFQLRLPSGRLWL